MTPTQTTFLLRFGELTLKSRPVRRRMTKRMLNNLRDGMRLHGIEAKIEDTWARSFITTSSPDVMRRLLSQLFGVHSFSEIKRVSYTHQDDIIAQAEAYFAPEIPGSTFAVRVRREKSLPISSQQLERELGAKLLKYGGKVDLTSPSLTCSIECRGKEAFFFAKVEKGPCGLPLGTEERVLTLISGGFDSPVATWNMMRRGAPCDFLFFELGGMAQRGTIYRHLQHLYREWSFGTKPRLFVIPGQPIMEALRKNIQQKYWNVMLKRIFYRVGEALVSKRRYAALVTGEAVAQVSSQTLSNLHSISHGISIPILRPVLTAEKDDIIALSRVIGSHDISAQVQEYCAITPSQPATRSTPEKVYQMEEDLGGQEWYEALLERYEQIEVSQVDPEQVRYLEAIIDRVPKEAIWIDMREEEGPPLAQDALPISLVSLIERPEQLSQDESYLLLCDVGMLSAEAAYMLQELGYRAYAFQGGIKRLQRLAPNQLKTQSNPETTVPQKAQEETPEDTAQSGSQ